MTCARRYSAVTVLALVLSLFGIALMHSGPASAGQRSPGQLTATQLALHKPVPTLAQSAQTHYVVKKGDNLSNIAKKVYGHANRWPAIWWKNHKRVHNPNRLRIGQWLILDSQATNDPHLMAKAMRHIPVVKVSHHYSIVGDSRVPAVPGLVAYSGGSSFRACVLRAESGGNYSAYNPASGAGGAYQFLQSTWTALGFPGSPQNAPPAMQDAAFSKAYAQSGTAPWAPYDGC